jgi:hypothetical protein
VARERVDLLEELRLPIARLRALERRRIEAGALGELLDRANEVTSPGHDSPVHIGSPERRLATMDEETARRQAVRDDALGTHA